MQPAVRQVLSASEVAASWCARLQVTVQLTRLLLGTLLAGRDTLLAGGEALGVT
jgi:hypothetical protein